MTDGQSEACKEAARPKIFMGIDPGTKGGLVMLGDYRNDPMYMRFSKSTWHDVGTAIIAFSRDEMFPVAVIERVSSMPGQGVSSTFKFGHAAGIVEGMLIARRIPYHVLTPANWPKEFIPPRKGEPKTDHKRRLKEAAQRLFPNEPICNEIADAYLLAEYCRRKWGK
jgi:crossover junction endodeoxyribonuclease RuvC